MSNIERRYIDADSLGIEERDTELDAEGKKIPVMTGFAATFGMRSGPLGGFEEEIQPYFFRQAIKPKNLEAFSLFNHNPDLVLGATRNNEVTVREVVEKTKEAPNGGLYQETLLLGDTTDSRNMEAHVRAGRIYKMSFAFQVTPDGEKWEIQGDRNLRTLLPDGCSKLWDVSPVTYPAYSSTSLGMRSLSGIDPDFERVLVALVRGEKNLAATKEDVAVLKEFRDRADKYLALVPAVNEAEVIEARERLKLLLLA